MLLKVKKIALGLFILFLFGCFSFYIIVLSGVFPKVQEIWVTTAMTTMNHEWLATAFIPKSTIDEIVERTRVDDSEYKTDVTELKPFTTPIVVPEVEQTIDIDTYLDEGYELLEDGIYKKDVSGAGWKGYLLLVVNPARVALAQTPYQFKRGDTVKNMVEDSEARVGINGGGFNDPNYSSNGGVPAGLLMVNGEIVSPENTNNNRLYSVIGFNTDNQFVLGKMTIKEAIENNIRDCVHFKPFLIVNGETVIKEGSGGWGIAPRTALGQRETGEVIFFCVDGRQVHSIGVDLRVLQDTLYDEGCINAAMVDGGSSTVMYHIDLGYLNKPSLGHERYINNAWIIK